MKPGLTLGDGGGPNLAKSWWQISTPVLKQSLALTLASRAAAYGLTILRELDGLKTLLLEY
jgi:hypothetical protein